MGKSIAWVTLAILGLSLIIGFYLRDQSWIGTAVRRPIQKDAADYFFYAYNMRHHNTYFRQTNQSNDLKVKPAPDAVRSPGYPLFLALLIDGPPDIRLIKKIQLFQMLVSTLTLVLSFFFYRCYLPPVSAAIASLLVALSPHLIMFNSYILSETLFCFVLVLMGLLTCRFINHPSPWVAVVVGPIMGIGSLIRPSLQFFPLVVAALLLLNHGRQKGLKGSLLILLGFLTILSPWLIRNVITLGKISDDTLKINFLHHGMYPDIKYRQQPESYGRPYKFDPRSKEIGASVYSVLEEIKYRLQAEPLNHLKWYLLKKPSVFWAWDTIQGLGDFYVYPVFRTPYSENPIFAATHKLMKWLHGPLVVLSLIGSLLVWIFPGRYGIGSGCVNSARFVAALLFYFTLFHMIGAPFPRYSVPLRPFQYGMALFCLHYVYAAMKLKQMELALCK